jgi:hypothetical protein
MNRVYFEETQTFRQSRWIWMVMVISLLAAILPILDGVYWQLFRGQPWGNKPMSDSGLLGLFVFILLTSIGCITLLISVRLEVKVDSEGVHYCYVPIKPRWQHFSKDQIESYSLEKQYKLIHSGFGFSHNRLNRTRRIRIRGGNHLFLVLRNGEKLLLGTQKPDELAHAMKKLMSSTEMI